MGLSLGPIGWRVRKNYFRVVQRPIGQNKFSPGHTQKHHLTKAGSQSQGKMFGISSPSSSFEKDLKDTTKDEFILNWTEYGQDKHIENTELGNVAKFITSIEHPYIYPAEHMAASENGALVIRRFNKNGTLKDTLCGCTPINPFLTKYGSPKGRNPVPLRDLAIYGRQIIEALRFLHTKGIAHGHVHAGNVIIIDGCAKLLELENFILGVPSFYRPFFIQHCKVNTLEAVDVYAFGHFIHELALGFPLQESCARQISDCPESLSKISFYYKLSRCNSSFFFSFLETLLESILHRDSLKNLPTLDQVAKSEFFKEYAPNFDELNDQFMSQSSVQWKITPAVKEVLRVHTQRCETRLRDEQRSVKNQKRLVRVQELMTSEEKEKKQKQKVNLGCMYLQIFSYTIFRPFTKIIQGLLQ